MNVSFFTAHEYSSSLVKKNDIIHTQFFINLCTYERENYQMDSFGCYARIV